MTRVELVPEEEDGFGFLAGMRSAEVGVGGSRVGRSDRCDFPVLLEDPGADILLVVYLEAWVWGGSVGIVWH